MEMIDVLKKLQEIAETKPELVKDAVESVEKTNPKEVEENAVESEAPTNKEPVKEYEDKIQEYSVGSYKDFLKSKGMDIYKLKGDDHVKWAKEYRAAKDQGGEAEYKKSGSRDHKTYTPSTSDEPAKVEADTFDPGTGGLKAKTPGGMSDVHIGADEYIGNYTRDDAPDTLKMPKADVLKAMAQEKAKAPFPLSYEIETAMTMVDEKFEDDGSPKDDMPEPDMDMASAEPETIEPTIEEGPHEDKQKAMQTLEALRDMVMELDIEDDAKTSAHTALDQVGEDIMMNTSMGDIDAESTELNTNTMATEGKKQVNEDIKMTADTPEEAGMLMQIMKLAGVQQVTPDMLGGQEPQAEPEANPEHGDEGHDHSDCPVCGDDAVGSEDMGKMRDLITAPDQEKNEETFANSVGEKDLPKTSDVDTLVNVHSGGENRQKQQVRKEYPGDNPLAVKEDTITELDLADSFRAQYEGFKKSYQEAAKVTEKKAKPDFLDMDKDGDKKEPMKKAIADKK